MSVAGVGANAWVWAQVGDVVAAWQSPCPTTVRACSVAACNCQGRRRFISCTPAHLLSLLSALVSWLQTPAVLLFQLDKLPLGCESTLDPRRAYIVPLAEDVVVLCAVMARGQVLCWYADLERGIHNSDSGCYEVSVNEWTSSATDSAAASSGHGLLPEEKCTSAALVDVVRRCPGADPHPPPSTPAPVSRLVIVTVLRSSPPCCT
jgi:hypothetical protein